MVEVTLSNTEVEYIRSELHRISKPDDTDATVHAVLVMYQAMITSNFEQDIHDLLNDNSDSIADQE